MTTTHIDDFDWTAVAGDLDRQGWALLPKLLTAAQSDAIAGMYGDTPAFRSRVVIARHGFGKGEYRYFSSPLPELVQQLSRCYRRICSREGEAR